MTGFGVPKTNPFRKAPVQDSSPKIPIGPNQLLMVDVSHYEPVIDYTKAVKWMRDTYGAAIFATKATDGLGSTDSAMARHRDGFEKAGADALGLYHFYRFGSQRKGPEGQALQFGQAIGTLRKKEFIALDFEWDNQGPEQYRDTEHGGKGQVDVAGTRDVLACAGFMSQIHGLRPWIYTPGKSSGWLDKVTLEQEQALSLYKLWVAHYGVPAPKLPGTWTRYTAWQFTDKLNVPGIGPCDASIFNGTLSDLAQLVKS